MKPTEANITDVNETGVIPTDFNPIISLFPKCKEPGHFKYISIDDYHKGIQNGQWKNVAKRVRAELDPKKRRELKESIVPAVTISAKCNYHSEEGVQLHSGLICVDSKNDIDIAATLIKLKKDPYVFACNRSISGTGLAIEFRIDPERHAEAYRGLENYLLFSYGLEIDNTPDISRYRFVSYDPDIYINKNAIVFDQLSKVEAKKEINTSDNFGPSGDFLFIYNEIIKRKIDITDTYQKWRNIGFALKSELDKNGRSFFHGLSQFHSDYDFDKTDSKYSDLLKSKRTGITMRTIFQYAKDAGIKIPGTSEIPANCFNESVYEYLPLKIQNICSIIPEPRKKDVFLVGTIAALSAAFSRWRFLHGSGSDIKEYSPHLCCLVTGPAGSGKGMARYGYEMIKIIAGEAFSKAAEARQRYMEQLQECKERAEEVKQEKARIKKEKLEGKEPTEPEEPLMLLSQPQKPKKICFTISVGDTTQAALVEILHDNLMGCFGYEPEIDSMIEGNKKEFGGFSDTIRKAFHHEPLARQRKEENESFIVQQPRLAFMLCGTSDQLKKLIASEQNGLFSRILFYVIPNAFIPYKMATNHTDIIGEMCDALASDVSQTANLWDGDLIYLSFSPAQEEELFLAMQDKEEMENKYGNSISASWLRLALIVKRIAVTLAAFENTHEGFVPDNCWKVAMEMLPTLKQHCIAALNVIRENYGKKNVSREEYEKLKTEGLTEEQIAEKLGITRKTLQAKRKEWVG